MASIPVASTILVTGAAGFIGSAVLARLASYGPDYRLVCLDVFDACASRCNLLEAEQVARIAQTSLEVIEGNVCDAATVLHICREYNVDTIMHFAAQTHVDQSFGDSLSFTETNVLGTHVMLEVARALKENIKKFIHVSTDEVYGEVPLDGKRCKENAKLNPTNPYAATKTAAEALANSYRTSFGLPIIVTRSNNVYGPQQYPEKLIPKFILLLKQNKPCPVHGTGKNRRTFLHVHDVATAFELILRKGKVGEVYNIGSDEEYENIQVLRKLINIFRQKELLNDDNDEHYITYVQDRAFNDFRYHIDCTQLRELGWRRKYTDFDEGLRQTVDWYLNMDPIHWHNWMDALAPHPHFETRLLTSRLPSHSQQFTANSGYVNRLNNSHSHCCCVAPALAPIKSNNLQLDSVDQVHVNCLRWLIYGRFGWIGVQVLEVLQRERPNDIILLPSSGANDEEGITADLRHLSPDRVLYCVDFTHEIFRTVDQFRQKENLTNYVCDNSFNPVVLALLCQQAGIHYTYIGPDCQYDDIRIGGNSNDLAEPDRQNFFGLSYTDRLMKVISKHALNVRIHLPIAAYATLWNFIAKISQSSKDCNVANSITVLPELLPSMLNMAVNMDVGTINLMNPGKITCNRLMELYRDVIDPRFNRQNSANESRANEQASERANKFMQTHCVQHSTPNIEQSVRNVLYTLATSNDAACNLHCDCQEHISSLPGAAVQQIDIFTCAN